MTISKIDPAGVDVGQIGGRRNLIINGAMQVAQRGTSGAVASSTTFPSVDRWKAVCGSAFNWQSTVSQSTTAPDGFGYSLKVAVDTAGTPTGGNNAVFYYRIEGQDCQALAYGTSSAKDATLSFWVRSNKTGTYCVSPVNNDKAYYTLYEYTINSADTWEYKTITISGDTARTINNDNGEGLDLRFSLAVGPDDIVSATNTWTSGGAIYATSNQVNLMDSNTNEWYITGVQLEVGTVATPFEHLSYGEELALCQRYFERLGNNAEAYAVVTAFTTSTMYGDFRFSPKRADPTMSSPGVAADYRVRSAGSNFILTSKLGFDAARADGFCRVNCNSSGFTVGYAGWLSRADNDTYIDVDAEL